jgi:hypothetical protein
VGTGRGEDLRADVRLAFVLSGDAGGCRCSSESTYGAALDAAGGSRCCSIIRISSMSLLIINRVE